LRRAAAALALAASFACAQPAPPSDSRESRTECPVLVSDGQYRMGTVLEISICAPDRASGEALLRAAFESVGALERRFSTFDPASDVSRLNGAAGRGPQPVSLDLARLTADSLAFSAETLGSFDVTVGPLVSLWGAAAKAGRRPSAAELAATRKRVGANLVRADLAAGTVELREVGAALDFGGIAKGWTLDRISESLRAAGVTRALLSFGESSIAAIGAAPGADGWGVALGDAAGGIAGTLSLRDRSLSVSGSLGQFVEIDGRRYGHVIDPRSGEPLERPQVAAALAPSGAQAEALSKALLVLGEKDGIALVESLPDAEGISIDESGALFETSGWRDATHFSPE
jgi:thiamine biosynthesis lipoprotein